MDIKELNKPLTPELKKKWVRALRSGKYQQGTGTLCEQYDGEYQYCCLGVLGRVMGFDPEELDKGILSDVGLGKVLGKRIECKLAELNDGGYYLGLDEADNDIIGESMPFELIAGFIEGTL